MDLDDKLQPPEKVILAAKLLYVVIGIGVLQALIIMIRHADVRSPVFLIISKILVYAFSVYLIKELSTGKNWARRALVVIFIIYFPLIFLPIFQSFTHYPFYGLLELAQLVLFVAAVALLFQRDVSSWFR